MLRTKLSPTPITAGERYSILLVLLAWVVIGALTLAFAVASRGSCSTVLGTFDLPHLTNSSSCTETADLVAAVGAVIFVVATMSIWHHIRQEIRRADPFDCLHCPGKSALRTPHKPYVSGKSRFRRAGPVDEESALLSETNKQYPTRSRVKHPKCTMHRQFPSRVSQKVSPPRMNGRKNWKCLTITTPAPPSYLPKRMDDNRDDDWLTPTKPTSLLE